ncbi:MAG: Rieske (2Fe-2S) protein [Planctomycetaceae bacterium]
MDNSFTTVATIGEIPDGEGRAFPVNGRMVAVFRRGDQYHAIADSCPHMGASLASGWVEGDAVICPWHAWKFCITDGSWLDSPKSKVRADAYEVRVEGQAIQVRVPTPDSDDASPM